MPKTYSVASREGKESLPVMFNSPSNIDKEEIVFLYFLFELFNNLEKLKNISIKSFLISTTKRLQH